MKEKNKDFGDLMDLTAIRIITHKEVDCYTVLGIAHSIFKPVSGRFKDYIAAPKPNGYQSIHTTVVGPDNQIVEIQIRTEQMHQIAEEGVAAHWKYKEKKSKDKNEAYYASVKKIIESNINDTFAKEVTVEILKKTIFVFTPKGDVVELQEGSTVLDFAFQVHTQIGYRTIGAKINDRIVTLDHVIHNGDKVEILTSKTAKGPGSDWINIVTSPSSKSKIKKWFKDKEFEEKSKIGEDLVIEAFSKIGIKFKDIEEDEKILLYMKKYNISNIEQLYYKFANNELVLENLVSKFEDKEKKTEIYEKIEEETAKTNSQMSKKDSLGVKVTGSDNTLFTFAKCCSPLPGDDIKGFVTRGRGIVIHRNDCMNILNSLKNEPEREIEVIWDEKLIKESNTKYQANFTVKTLGREGILMDIIRIMTEYKINLVGVNTNVTKENGKEVGHIHFNVLIKDKKYLEKLFKHLNSMPEITGILRK